MDEKIIRRFEKDFRSKSTEELLSIWTETKNKEWSGESLEAVRRLLESRGHEFLPNEPSSESRFYPQGPVGTHYVCPACHVAFDYDGHPRVSFLGFVNLYCPRCGRHIKYPLTKRVRNMCFVALLSALVLCFFLKSALWQIMFLTAFILLSVDCVRRTRVRRAWFKHYAEGQPKHDGVSVN